MDPKTLKEPLPEPLAKIKHLIKNRVWFYNRFTKKQMNRNERKRILHPPESIFSIDSNSNEASMNQNLVNVTYTANKEVFQKRETYCFQTNKLTDL